MVNNFFQVSLEGFFIFHCNEEPIAAETVVRQIYRRIPMRTPDSLNLKKSRLSSTMQISVAPISLKTVPNADEKVEEKSHYSLNHEISH